MNLALQGRPWHEVYAKRRKKGLPPVCGHPKHFAKGLCKKCYRLQPHVKSQEQAFRKKDRFKKYGLTEDTYNELVAAQGYKCPICLGPPKHARWNTGSIDHCHKTGKVRGILCERCNILLGNAGDDIPRLQRAIEYLQRVQSKE